MSDPIETKLSAARTRLILDRPFLGALVLRLPLVEVNTWCKSTATDAKTLYYNRAYIDSLSLEQTQFMLAHDALHCALLHFARRHHRDKHRWDIACDFAVNPLLISEGLKPPPDVFYLKEYEGMTAEEIYPLLEDMPDQETTDQHVYDQAQNSDDSNQTHSAGISERDLSPQQGAKQDPQEDDMPEQQTGGHETPPPPLPESEKEALAVQWQQRLAGAAQSAIQSGKLGGDMARLVDHLLQPQLPWRMLLARYMTSIGRDDYSFSRPSSRRDMGGAVFPGLRSASINLTVLVDTSGSISDEEIACFFSEINAIKGQMRARIMLHACDIALASDGPWVYEAWEDIKMPVMISGGGGTDFRPAFSWVDGCDNHPDIVVYFTDAIGRFPRQAPYYPVIWLVKGKGPVPWGQRIQLN